MGVFFQEIKKVEREDAHGNVTVDMAEVTKAVSRHEEPDYIKLYADAWRRDNDIPERYRHLFLLLAMRMTYASLGKRGEPDEGGQIVYVVGPVRKAILEECGWHGDDALCKGLKALVDCNAIRKISRGVYQINPKYAARGTWHYHSRKQQGGIENLLAVFKRDDNAGGKGRKQAAGKGRVGLVEEHATIEVEDEIECIAEEIRSEKDVEKMPF